MQLSPLAAVFVQQENPRPSAAQDAPAPPAPPAEQASLQGACSTTSPAAPSAQPMSAIKRMLNPFLFDSRQRSKPAQESGQAGTAAAAVQDAESSGQPQPAQQSSSSSPAPAQQQPRQGVRGPPPGFGPQPSSSGMQQQPVPAPPAPPAASSQAAPNGPQSTPRAEAPAPAAYADVPASQAPGYTPAGQPHSPAPQPPPRTPMFNSAAQWQQRPVSPLDAMQQQQSAFHFPPAFGAPYSQPQPPQPPGGPGYAQGYKQAGHGGVFPGSPAGFDSHASAFGPPGAGYVGWHQQQQQQQHVHTSQHAAAMGLYALQQLAQQRRQHQAAAAAAASGHVYNGYPGTPMNSYGKPPAPAGIRHGTPPPPPRPGMPAQGCNSYASAAQPRRPQSAYHPGAQRAGYAVSAGPYAGGQPGGYTGFGSRYSSWQGHEAAAAGFEVQREQRCSSSRLDLNPVLAALPRSSSALWEPSFSSPRCSNSNLRKSSSCDSIHRLGSDAPGAAPLQLSGCAADAAGAPLFLAIAGAVAGAGVGSSNGGLTPAAGSAATLRAWLSPGPRAHSPEASGKAGASPAAKDDTSAGQDDTGITFIAAAPAAQAGARALQAAPSKASIAERSNSSGGGSLFGRVSSRSLVWDPLSTISSGGGAKPSAGDAAAVKAGSSAASSAKTCAVAAKVPLVYTPAAMLGQGMWGSGGSVGGSGGFGLQLMPDQLDEMFRVLRAGVRGPDARPI